MALDAKALEAARAEGYALGVHEIRVEKIVTAYLAALGDGWQPIETIPHDGRSVAVWVANGDIVPHCFSPVSVTEDGGWWDDNIGGQIEPIAGATHWRHFHAPTGANPMSKSGKRLIEAAQEAVAIAKGEQPAASIYHNGHKYVPATALEEAERRAEEAERERDEARLKASVIEGISNELDIALTASNAEAERLREALRRVADLDIVEASLDPGWFRRHARAALEGSPDV